MKKQESQLSHTDNQGRARMVDVGDKVPMRRVAVASGRIALQAATLDLIRQNQVKKGDVLGIARIAGIQAAKMTPSLIPLCHPLLLTHIGVDALLSTDGVEVRASVSCDGQTGVEMEALAAVSTALLTVYDMCKAVDKEMVISDIRLEEKTKTSIR